MYVHAVVKQCTLLDDDISSPLPTLAAYLGTANISHCVYPPSNLLRMNFLVDAKILKSGEESGRPPPDMAGINE